MMEKYKALILSPHPDDDAISMATHIRRTDDTVFYVVYTTNGSPLNVYPLTKKIGLTYKTKKELADARRKEAIEATELLGIHENHLFFSDIDDSTLSYNLRRAEDFLRHVLDRTKPDIVFAPPYEGAHMDHDATSLLLERILRRDVWFRSFEYASYNNHNGNKHFLEFAVPNGSENTEIAPFEEAALKQRVLDVYKSQHGGVIEEFPRDRECLRTRIDGSANGIKPVMITYCEQFFNFSTEMVDESYAKMKEFISLS